MKNPHIEEVIKKLESKSEVINDSLWYVDPQDIREVFQEYQRQVREMVEEMQVKESHIGIGGLYTAEVEKEINSVLSTLLSHPLLNNK